MTLSRVAATVELTPGEYRAMMLRNRRWAHVCLDAGELDEARRLIEEAARFGCLADEIESRRFAA